MAASRPAEELSTGRRMSPYLDFGHSGGVTERVGDAFAERRTEFCGSGWMP
jgi:hypothetical protein